LTRLAPPPADRLTRRALRGYAAALALGLWVVAAYSLATPGRIDRFGTLKAVDFVSAWFSGRLVAEGRESLLYDRGTWRDAVPRLFPDAPGLLFLPNYPPQAALLFAPFGRLPYGHAAVAWTIVSLAVYAWSVAALWRAYPALAGAGVTVALAALGWPAFFLLVLNGQNTSLVIASYALAAIACAGRREVPMGAALGLCAIKPHFALVPALVLLCAGRWRALSAMAAVTAAQAGAVAWTLGTGVLAAYAESLVELARDPAVFEPRLWQAQGAASALDLLLGRGPLSSTLYGVTLAAGTWIVARAWRDEALSPARQFALLVVASALLNPHLHGYDLVVLAPALLFAADWCVRHAEAAEARRLAWIALALVLVPLAAPLAAVTRVQLTAPLLAWFGWMLLRLREDRARSTARP
jgi:hypothetical protein